MFIKHVLAFVVAGIVLATTASADPPPNINGVWVVDARATEGFFARQPLPPDAEKIAEWFGLMAGYLPLFIYEADDKTAVAKAYRSKRVFEYQRASALGSDTKFVSNVASSPIPKTLTVSMLDSGNLRIVPSDHPEIGNVLWRRSEPRAESSTPDEVMAAAKIWLASVQIIVQTLRQGPNSSNKVQEAP